MHVLEGPVIKNLEESQLVQLFGPCAEHVKQSVWHSSHVNDEGFSYRPLIILKMFKILFKTKNSKLPAIQSQELVKEMVRKSALSQDKHVVEVF